MSSLIFLLSSLNCCIIVAIIILISIGSFLSSLSLYIIIYIYILLLCYCFCCCDYALLGLSFVVYSIIVFFVSLCFIVIHMTVVIIFLSFCVFLISSSLLYTLFHCYHYYYYPFSLLYHHHTCCYFLPLLFSTRTRICIHACIYLQQPHKKIELTLISVGSPQNYSSRTVQPISLGLDFYICFGGLPYRVNYHRS